MFSGEVCPRCGSKLVYEEIRGFGAKGSRTLFAVSLLNPIVAWLIGAATAQGRTGYMRCYTCGFVWRVW